MARFPADTHDAKAHITTFRIYAMSSCPKNSVPEAVVSTRREKEKKRTSIWFVVRRRHAPHRTHRDSWLGSCRAESPLCAARSQYLNPDAGARIAALRILQPFFGLVRCHIDLLIEERYDLCVGFAHHVHNKCDCARTREGRREAKYETGLN